MSKKILIGGAWPYANNSLHLGHLAGLISGDILARYHRQIGDDVIYVSGSDCHGTPITERAKKENTTPCKIAEGFHQEFCKVFEAMNFSYNLYTKTNDDYHKSKVKELFKKMYDNGYIYEKIDKDNYCEKCNKFLADRELKLICPVCGNETKGDQCDCGHVPTKEELAGSICVECGNKTIVKDNKNLYIALSKLQPQIEEYVSLHKNNWRKNAQNETDKYLKQGLRDRAVTRDLNWGVEIPVEGYENKRMYVWIEAVLGYVTATMKYCEENNLDWRQWWKESDNNKMYMVHGKDNITFHSLIFPGLLLALEDNYKLPDMIVSTEYLNFNDQKFSKSKGIGMTILDAIEELNVDTLRLHLIKNGPERKDNVLNQPFNSVLSIIKQYDENNENNKSKNSVNGETDSKVVKNTGNDTTLNKTYRDSKTNNTNHFSVNNNATSTPYMTARKLFEKISDNVNSRAMKMNEYIYKIIMFINLMRVS